MMDVINYFKENDYINITDRRGNVYMFEIIGIENIDKYQIKLNIDLFGGITNNEDNKTLIFNKREDKPNDGQ